MIHFQNFSNIMMAVMEMFDVGLQVTFSNMLAGHEC